jgi:hypothetical protein
MIGLNVGCLKIGLGCEDNHLVCYAQMFGHCSTVDKDTETLGSRAIVSHFVQR